jgi:hypothetical protein
MARASVKLSSCDELVEEHANVEASRSNAARRRSFMIRVSAGVKGAVRRARCNFGAIQGQHFLQRELSWGSAWEEAEPWRIGVGGVAGQVFGGASKKKTRQSSAIEQPSLSRRLMRLWFRSESNPLRPSKTQIDFRAA